MSDSLQPHGLEPTSLLRLWDFSGKSTGVGCHFLIQGIFRTQGSNSGLPHCRQTLYHLSHQGSPYQPSMYSVRKLCLTATPRTTARRASLSITISRSLLKLMSLSHWQWIQPSHPLLATSPPAPDLSQHQGLFQWIGFSHQVAKLLELQL